MDDLKEILTNILIQEMDDLDLSFVSKSELRRQNLDKAAQQLISISREFDNYSHVPEIFDTRLQQVSAEINSIWNELNEEGIINSEDEE